MFAIDCNPDQPTELSQQKQYIAYDAWKYIPRKSWPTSSDLEFASNKSVMSVYESVALDIVISTHVQGVKWLPYLI